MPPTSADDQHRVVRDAEYREQARDQVDAGRDHRRGVDQGADRRRALHGVRQPHVQRELRRLARGAGEDAEGEPGQHGRAQGAGDGCVLNRRDVERAGLGVDQQDRRRGSRGHRVA